MSDYRHTHGDDKRHEDDGQARVQSTRPSALLIELREHVPFSVSAVAIGLIVAGVICILGFESQGGVEAGVEDPGIGPGHEHTQYSARLFFHLFHPAHMLFSAVATAAMFCRYDRSVAKAVVIGFVGAVGVCGISDIVIPHASLLILHVKTPWHICVYEHPTLVLPFAAVGVVVGIAAAGGVIRSTIISHSLHVLMSTMASIFYMIGPLGMVAWIDILGKVFIFIVLAVMVPCCISDIVFPMLMSRSSRESYVLEPHAH